MAPRDDQDIILVGTGAADAVGVAQDVGELACELNGGGCGDVFVDGVVGVGVKDAIWFGVGPLGVWGSR